MLKITYLESGLYLEHLQETVEEWIALRVILSLRMGQRLIIERNTASLLLPIALIKRSAVVAELRRDTAIQLSQVDADYVEISFEGTWISSHDQEANGVFVTMLHPALEQGIFDLWQTTQASPSSAWR